MQFNEYINVRNRMARMSEAGRAWAKRAKPDEFRKQVEELYKKQSAKGNYKGSALHGLTWAERRWVETKRPFYNIWPVVSELASKIKLDLPFSAIEPPFECMVLRFAKGNEPYGVTTAMIW